MTSRSSTHAAIALIVICLAAFSFFSLARAASIFDITFPIPELGNCADRLACKAYCNDPANQSACESFAQAHGLNTNPQSTPPAQTDGQSADSGGDKLQAIQKDGGPGQCAAGASDPEKACKAYCNDTAHIQECVAYGKSHGFLTGDQLSQAEKIAAALKNGAQLPQGCTDQQSCGEICQNPSSLEQARSCFSFAKAAGILPPGFDEAQAEKVFSAIQDGTAPFSSMKDFQQCEHPTDPAILKKCTDFAVQSGQMTQQQADVVQKTGGKGPGGCTGKDACDQYCTQHQDECFQFAQQNGLVPPDQEQHMQEAANQLKQALDSAPPSVKDCITSAVGQDTLSGLLSGTTPGTPKVGETMQQCFQQMQGDMNGGKGQVGGDRQFGPPSEPGQEQGGPQGGGMPMDNQGPGGNGPFGPPPPNDGGRFMPPPPNGNQNGPTGPMGPQGFDNGQGQNRSGGVMQGEDGSGNTQGQPNWQGMPGPNSDANGRPDFMPPQGTGSFNGPMREGLMPDGSNPPPPGTGTFFPQPPQGNNQQGGPSGTQQQFQMQSQGGRGMMPPQPSGNQPPPPGPMQDGGQFQSPPSGPSSQQSPSFQPPPPSQQSSGTVPPPSFQPPPSPQQPSGAPPPPSSPPPGPTSALPSSDFVAAVYSIFSELLHGF